MRFDNHLHTPLCGHAFGHPEAYVRKAAENGIKLITFSCHIPMKERDFGQTGVRMRESELDEYVEMVGQARELGVELGVEVLTGIEAEVFPDRDIMRRMDETLDREGFDFILGSLHHQMSIYRKWLSQNGKESDFDIVESYFAHLTIGASSGRYHSMSHPDVIRLYGTLNTRFDPAPHEASIRTFLQAAHDANVCLEVNTSGLNKGDFVFHPDPLILGWAVEHETRFTLGSDAHAPEQVGQHFDRVLNELKSHGIHQLHYFRRGERMEVPIDEML